MSDSGRPTHHVARDSGSPLTDLDDGYSPNAETSAAPGRTPASGRRVRGGKAGPSSTPIKRYPTSRDSPVVISAARREANRLAAERSRVRQGERAKILETMAKGLAEENMALKERVRKLIAMGVVPPEGLEALVRAIVTPNNRTGSDSGDLAQSNQVNDAEAEALLQHLQQSGSNEQLKDRDGMFGESPDSHGHPGVDGLLHLGINNNALSELAAAAEAAGTRHDIDPSLRGEGQPSREASGEAGGSQLDGQVAVPQQVIPGLAAGGGLTNGKQPLTKEMESLLRSEISQLQTELSSFNDGTHLLNPDAAGASSISLPPTETPPEILVLRDLARRIQDSNDLARERREKLKLELGGPPKEDESAQASAAEGSVAKAAGSTKTPAETVEQALTDVKARVELLLNHYNPSYVFSPLSAEDAFTLPERFEPIPLPEPQRRGRPARDTPKPPRRKRTARNSGAGGDDEDRETPPKRARTRLGRPGRLSINEHHPTRPSGLANELRLDDDDNRSVLSHDEDMDRQHVDESGVDRHGEMILDPSLAQAAAEVSYREQRQDTDAGDPSMMLKHYLSGEGPQHRADEMEVDFAALPRME